MLDRRSAIKTVAACAATGLAPAIVKTPEAQGADATDPRDAAIEWFRKARFGLFLHYGLYSLEGRGEWLQFKERIPVAEYARLRSRFTAKGFSAERIADLALAAGCRYVNLTTRHHDSFCLFETEQTDFHAVNSPAGRDLVGEMTTACRDRGLVVFFYYSHGRDWRHPHAPNNGAWGGNARPKYDPPDPAYRRGEEHDLQRYVAFMSAQVKELLTNYGPIGGVWLDGISTPLSRPERLAEFRTQALYDQIRASQPGVLVSYKQGLLGTEDFFAPERVWRQESAAPVEICDTLQPHGWGYVRADDGKHKSADAAIATLRDANRMGANLLLNTGPLPDGSIHPEDVATLTAMGRRLRTG